MQPYQLSITAAAALLASGEMSPVELTRSVLQRAHEVEPDVQAYALLCDDAAMASAMQAEQELTRGEHRGPLHGIPLAVKDLVATAGIATAAGSRLLDGAVPRHDAHVVTLLKSAGAVLVGKARTHEYAAGYSTPPTRNPHDLTREPGGSSGGSAATVVARGALGAIGTDTGGSIRIPAALCGATGLKPTYGRVSRFGVYPLSWSLDHVGPIGRDVEDVALLLGALAGHDPRDPASLKLPSPDFTTDLDCGVAGTRLGVPSNWFWTPVSPVVKTRVSAAIARLEEAGAELIEVQLPLADVSLAIGWSILMAEAGAYHHDSLAQRAHLFGDDVRALVEGGQTVLAGDYVRGVRARSLMQSQWHDLFERERLDALLCPTVPVTAPLVGQQLLQWSDGTESDVLSTYARWSQPANVTGLPALSVPCGSDDLGLPIGLQVIGRPLQESTVLRIGRAYEVHADVNGRVPAPRLPVSRG
ncbi:amidase [Mycolicibacterium sp. YH-1]|uniref:amidase n=1 Tax=Mycolicibacterium sp. YH-1 TaxID=2908837 RepID=UPI001F4C4DEE|nr:amidase [Mycolicibacterium sp. YH-1]UNB53144.1 amidase family protein [Mycolicibacterium sp. YH-1]